MLLLLVPSPAALGVIVIDPIPPASCTGLVFRVALVVWSTKFTVPVGVVPPPCAATVAVSVIEAEGLKALCPAGVTARAMLAEFA